MDAATGRPRVRRTTTLVAVLVAVVLALAACATGGSHSTTVGSSAPSSSASPSSSSPTTVSPSSTTGADRGVSRASARPLVVTGLGDSVMSGTACNCEPFISTYATALGAHQHVPAKVTNLGKPGLTVSGLAKQLDTESTLQALASASVVVVTIGANDLGPLVDRWRNGDCSDQCVSDATTGLSAPLDAVLTRIKAAAPDSAQILVTTYWNVFEDGAVADADYGPGFASWSDAVTLAANAQICRAADLIGAPCVDLYVPFNGSGSKDPTPLLAEDGDHPNAAGHDAIAKALLAATAPTP
ncbi:SGNH/GDSL hydrolase family protein [Pedococcus sp. KACC 23699]|uniref:SGNH/GDSL hydrolase family protein n=1 Tax=Pedococcus sp. KACC 23699 TaxID=3149228 RepID=A0AAU7JZK4_9MICO